MGRTSDTRIRKRTLKNRKTSTTTAAGWDETGAEQKDALFTDSKSDNPTLEGEVYALLVDIAGKEEA